MTTMMIGALLLRRVCPCLDCLFSPRPTANIPIMHVMPPLLLHRLPLQFPPSPQPPHPRLDIFDTVPTRHQQRRLQIRMLDEFHTAMANIIERPRPSIMRDEDVALAVA
jgi:hypothetical protein